MNFYFRSIFSGFLVLAVSHLMSTAQAKEPNIIFILADDMGYDSVSALNPELGFETPHIDKMISEGMSFSDAHSGSAVCTPTRYGVLTGRYSWRSRLKRGIVGQYEHQLIDSARLTVGDMLKERGYDTACIGKWHLGFQWYDKGGDPTRDRKIVDFSRSTTGGPIDQGFDYYFGDDVPNWPPYVWFENAKTLGIPSLPKPKEMYGSPGVMMPGWTLEEVLPEITRRSVKYITEQAKSDKPFFLYFPMTSPHTPIAPSVDFRGKSGLGEYVDFVVETDWCVGEILRAVEESGISEETLIVFTTDNGTSTKASFADLETKGVQLRHQFRGNKADIFEGGHRVPFVAKWDGKIAAGSESDEVICLTDFMATAAEVAGSELPENAAEDSVSLWPVLSGAGRGGLANREAIINHSIDGSFAVRRGKWKLCFSHGSAGWSEPKESAAIKQGLPPMQLFNLERDLKEQVNVHESHPEVVEELTLLLKNYIANGRSTPGKIQPNDAGEIWWAQLPWESGE
tara:strand:+ start:3323 stop:4858 length:1536 start_codon:yes stop_codon:yes gene_type:complete